MAARILYPEDIPTIDDIRFEFTEPVDYVARKIRRGEPLEVRDWVTGRANPVRKWLDNRRRAKENKKRARPEPLRMVVLNEADLLKRREEERLLALLLEAIGVCIEAGCFNRNCVDESHQRR